MTADVLFPCSVLVNLRYQRLDTGVLGDVCTQACKRQWDFYWLPSVLQGKYWYSTLLQA